MTALAAVLAGKARPGGRSPVAVPGLPATTCAYLTGPARRRSAPTSTRPCASPSQPRAGTSPHSVPFARSDPRCDREDERRAPRPATAQRLSSATRPRPRPAGRSASQAVILGGVEADSASEVAELVGAATVSPGCRGGRNLSERGARGVTRRRVRALQIRQELRPPEPRPARPPRSAHAWCTTALGEAPRRRSLASSPLGGSMAFAVPGPTRRAAPRRGRRAARRPTGLTGAGGGLLVGGVVVAAAGQPAGVSAADTATLGRVSRR